MYRLHVKVSAGVGRPIDTAKCCQLLTYISALPRIHTGDCRRKPAFFRRLSPNNSATVAVFGNVAEFGDNFVAVCVEIGDYSYSLQCEQSLREVGCEKMDGRIRKAWSTQEYKKG